MQVNFILTQMVCDEYTYKTELKKTIIQEISMSIIVLWLCVTTSHS